MVWCGFAILYMFSGLVISGVEAKYGHLVLFMMLLALFSYFQAVVYNYRYYLDLELRSLKQGLGSISGSKYGVII